MSNVSIQGRHSQDVQIFSVRRSYVLDSSRCPFACTQSHRLTGWVGSFLAEPGCRFEPEEDIKETGSSLIPGSQISDLDLLKDAKPTIEDSDDEEMPDPSMLGKGKGRARPNKVSCVSPP